MVFQDGDFVGSYVIDRCLSKIGGMAQVYLAHVPNRPQYKVVIKANLTKHVDQFAFAELLRYEAETLKLLRHPGIVHIYPMRIGNKITYMARAIEHPEKPWYFTEEYIAGDNLHNQLKQIMLFPIEWIVELFYQLLVIVRYMHQVGYAHCDLKPTNLLFRHTPLVHEVPQPVLIDFGSVSQINKGLRTIAASIQYSPPELILAMNQTEKNSTNLVLRPDKIDIWALGAILFEIITGQPLINKTSKDEITTSVIRGQLSSIRDIRPDVHQSFDIMLRQILSNDPLERPSVDTLIEAIEERISLTLPPRIKHRGKV